ncbi:MAG TPA: N-acetylneuraminate synthase family protein [Anaerolineales bacterium]|nr:N-acetylneuraminate synthase family protein [Anaerolineales bacterium]
MKRPKAYILGAGVSGLVTGWKLLERGWDVEIIEREPFYGGMARTWRWKEFLLDVGPHLYHTPDSQIADFWEREFGDLFVKGDFWCKNVKGSNFDEYYEYPLSYESIFRYPADLRQKILSELERINPEDRAKARNYKEYVNALVGPTLQEMFFEDYPRKIWGLRTEEMTASWAPKRIELREKITPFYDGQWNAVGKYGTGCVYERIYQKILGLGGCVRLGQGVKGFGSHDGVITRLLLEQDDTIEVDPRDVIVSTIPISLLCRLLGIPCTLRFRGVTSVYLAFNREYVLPEGIHWLYYDSPELLFHRLSEQKKFSPECAVPEKTCLTAEIAYSRGDHVDKMSSEKLIQAVLDQIYSTGLVQREEFIDGTMNRQPAVYPLLHKDYQHEVAQAQSRLGEFRQIYSIGTTGEFNYADSQILFLKAFDLVDILTGQYSELSQVRRKQYVAALNTTVSLNGKIIGADHRPYMIAEAGLNHNGSLELALQLVDRAVEAGCDAIKFQTYKSSSRISGKIKKVRYAETTLGEQETLLEMFQRLEMSYEDHKRLFDYARRCGIEIFSTPFDCESVDLLESLGVNFYKIASFDLCNIPLLRYVASTKKPMILSTGMSTLGQIEEALDAIRGEGGGNVVLLHCISAYPAAPEDMNLNAIKTLKESFRVPVGLSDHTLGIQVSLIALSLGANAIERHFTLSRAMEGPDHILSSEPEEMRELVHSAHIMSRILGDGVKKIEPCEYETINAQRKSLYARVDIHQGEVVTLDMVAIKGPGGGLQPRYLDVIVGRTAKRAIKADYPITWEDI